MRELRVFLTIFVLLIIFAVQPAFAVRNLLKNGHFENGLQNWTVPSWRTDMLKPQVDSSIMHGPGQGSILFSGEKGKSGIAYQDIKPRAGVKNYRGSAWVRLSKFERWWEAGVAVEFIGEQGEWLGIATCATLGTDVSGDLDWKKIEGEFTIPEGTAIIRVELVMRSPMPNNEPANLGSVWFDDVIIEESANNDAPALPDITIDKFIPKGTGGLFLPSQQPQLNLNISNYLDKDKKLDLCVVVRDFYNKVVYKNIGPLELKQDPRNPEQGKVVNTITVPKLSKHGFYGVTTEISDGQKILVSAVSSFCVVKPMAKGNKFLGLTCFDSGDFKTTKLLGAGKYAMWIPWRQIESRRGVFDFKQWDAILQPWHGGGFEVIGYIDTRFTPGGSYISPDWLDKMVLDWRQTNKTAYPDEYYKAWGNYVFELVKHYKNKIKEWTLCQEIDLTLDQPGGAQHYIRLVKEASAAAKKADPTCTIGGISVSGCDGQAGFTVARQLWAELNASLDGFFWDCYVDPKEFGPGYQPVGEERGGLRNIILEARDIIKPYGKTKLGIDEKGCKIVSALPVDSFYAKDLAKVIARGFVIAKSVPQMQHYMYFITNSESCKEGDADYGLWKEGSPRPSVAAYATSARMLQDTLEPVEVNLHKDVLAYVFKKGKGSLAVVWTILKDPVPLAVNMPASAVSYDLMGNAIASIKKGKYNFSATESPVYIVSNAAPKALAAAISGCKFSLPLVKLDAKIADSRSVRVYVSNQSSKQLKANIKVQPVAGVKIAVRNSAITVPAGKTGSAVFTSQGSLKPFTLHAEVAVNGLVSKLDKELSFNSVPRVKEDVSESDIFALKSIVFDSPANIFPSGGDAMANKLWTGKDDLSVKLYMAWESKNLHVAALVKDDQFVQEQTGMLLWAGDGFQLAFDTLNNALDPELTVSSGYGSDDYEYGIALTKEGPQAYCWTAASVNKPLERKILSNVPVIKQIDSATMSYHWTIPWQNLAPLKPASGKAFAFNFSYADIDKPGEEVRYWMGPTAGICSGKNPSIFRTFVLE